MVLRPLPVMQVTVSSSRLDAAVRVEASGDRRRDAAGRFGEDAFGLGKFLDGGDDFDVGYIFGPSAGLANGARSVEAVGGIADSERAGNGIRAAAARSRPVAFLTALAMGEQPVACAPKNLTGLSSTRPSATNSSNALRILVMSEPPAMGHDYVVRETPAELLGDFKANCLGAFGIEGAQVDVDETPVVAIGDLRAETIDVVVVAVDADQRRAVNLGVENLRRLEIGGDEDVGLEAEARGVRGNGVGQVAGRRAADGVKSKRCALASATATTRSLKLSVGRQTASFLM